MPLLQDDGSTQHEETNPGKVDSAHDGLQGVMDNTMRIARMRLLLKAAKLVFHDNREKVRFSIHDTRTPAMMNFLKSFVAARSNVRPRVEGNLWPRRFSLSRS